MNLQSFHSASQNFKSFLPLGIRGHCRRSGGKTEEPEAGGVLQSAASWTRHGHWAHELTARVTLLRPAHWAPPLTQKLLEVDGFWGWGWCNFIFEGTTTGRLSKIRQTFVHINLCALNELMFLKMT